MLAGCFGLLRALRRRMHLVLQDPYQSLHPGMRVGAAVGVGGAKILYDSLAMTKLGPMIWTDLRMRPAGLAFCVGLSLLIGLAASGWSAWRAARAPIADALRSSG